MFQTLVLKYLIHEILKYFQSEIIISLRISNNSRLKHSRGH